MAHGEYLINVSYWEERQRNEIYGKYSNYEGAKEVIEEAT